MFQRLSLAAKTHEWSGGDLGATQKHQSARQRSASVSQPSVTQLRHFVVLICSACAHPHYVRPMNPAFAEGKGSKQQQAIEDTRVYNQSEKKKKRSLTKLRSQCLLPGLCVSASTMRIMRWDRHRRTVDLFHSTL